MLKSMNESLCYVLGTIGTPGYMPLGFTWWPTKWKSFLGRSCYLVSYSFSLWICVPLFQSLCRVPTDNLWRLDAVPR